jgi:hypothetical protein
VERRRFYLADYGPDAGGADPVDGRIAPDTAAWFRRA